MNTHYILAILQQAKYSENEWPLMKGSNEEMSNLECIVLGGLKI